MAWRQVFRQQSTARAAPTAATAADIQGFGDETASRLVVSVEQDPEGTTWNGTVQVWSRRAGGVGFRWTQVELTPMATGADSNTVAAGQFWAEATGLEFYIQHTPNGAPTGSVTVYAAVARS
jgi:hypothetical protein